MPDRADAVRLPVVLALAAAACGPGDGGPATATADRVPHLELVEDLRIDGHAENLVPIGWMGVGPDGTMALLQGQDYAVRFFAPSGEDLGAVGREGEGPGEFQAPLRGGWLADTVWISDFQSRRVTLIGPEPGFARTLPPIGRVDPAPAIDDSFPPFSLAFPYALRPGDSLLVMAGAPLEEFEREGSFFFLASADGSLHRLVLEVPHDPDATVGVGFGEGGMRYYGVPFRHRPQWTVAPDGSRVGLLTTGLEGPEAGTFRVSVRHADGREIFSRTYLFAPVPVPSGVRDSAIAARGADDLPSDVERSLRSDLQTLTPTVFPPVDGIVIGSDGRTWVGLSTPGDGPDGGKDWLILGPDGEPQARVSVPPRSTLRGAGAMHLWVTERDPLDVESVVRYRIRDGG